LSSAPGFAQEAEFGLKKSVFKFPKTDEGTLLVHNYEVINTGDAPLFISNYKVGCSCTKVKLPKDSIQPGDTLMLEVSFDTEGKYYFQDREILIFANTKKAIHKLRFKVNITPKQEAKQ